MTREQYEARVDRLARIAAGLTLLLLVWYVYSIGSFVFLMARGGMLREMPAAQLLASAATVVGAVVILALTLGLVRSLRGGGSPFTLKNADRLRLIGWLLIAYELLMTLMPRLYGSMSFQSADGSAVSVSSHNSLGGMLIAVGLAVLGISYVFRYGVELQKLSDETL